MTPYLPHRPHPWHGLPLLAGPPGLFHAYIEITPFDKVKYEVDKATGYLKVDRPQRTASLPPTLYGFLPRTLCAGHVAALCPTATRGDGDPLDVCVISERPIDRADILLRVRVVGGLRMVDAGEADDKILAVLDQDPVWGDARELTDLPSGIVERLRHYFMTYKLTPGGQPVAIDAVYDAAHAGKVIEASVADYDEAFPRPIT
ncbi:MAG: inorganic pyrophosphatase [Pseudomonadota bacterium]|nr:inorganic pyrophosphatase [Pseudomonadota bacterium]